LVKEVKIHNLLSFRECMVLVCSGEERHTDDSGLDHPILSKTPTTGQYRFVLPAVHSANVLGKRFTVQKPISYQQEERPYAT
jgi:hypothetical protein